MPLSFRLTGNTIFAAGKITPAVSRRVLEPRTKPEHSRAVERRYVLKTPARAVAYRVDYDRELNEEQREVVLAGGGPVLVIAGAGSGKTRTLVYRVARLIESGTDPARILLLTFTNKAARDMLRRVETLLTVDTRRLMGGTFHSVGNRLLRRFGSRVGLPPNFTILDPEDAREMLEAATSDHKIPVVERRFPKGDVLLDLYSYTINTGRPFAEVLFDRAPHFSPLEAQIVSVFQRYRERKRAANACDYDDLLLSWKRLLDEIPDAAGSCDAPTITSSWMSIRTPIASRERSWTAWRG